MQASGSHKLRLVDEYVVDGSCLFYFLKVHLLDFHLLRRCLELPVFVRRLSCMLYLAETFDV
jgi:hypothetical protein